MIITLKTIQQQTFTVEFDESKTVKELKQTIEETKGSDFPVAGQKLIYSGKILNDDEPISQYNIEENKCVVLFVSKVTKSPAVETTKATTTTATSSASTAATTSASKTAESSTKSTESTTAAANTSTSAAIATPSTAQSQAESQMLIGTELETVIRNIMEMGYDRTQVERALQASFNNPERAVEYLVSGNIPVNEDLAELAPQEGEGRAQPTGQAGSHANPLEFLRNQPQYNQMCQLLRSNPGLLNTVMSQLRSSNPQLLELISQNQDDFLRMVNESTPATGGGNSGSTPAVSSRPSSAHSDSTAGSVQFEGLMDENSISAADKASIERLKGLGFPEYLVVQAYFACEKNEDLAADFLLSQATDD